MTERSLDIITGRTLINSFSDPIMILDCGLTAVMANQALLSFLQIPESDCVGKPFDTLVHGLDRTDPQWKHLEKKSDGMVREGTLHSNNQRIEVMITISPLFVEGQCDGFIMLFRDMRSVRELMDSLKKAYRKMTELVITDGLTKLYNRAHFNERIVEFYEETNLGGHDHFTFIMFDIDHFKDINDNLGHQTGDEVLITLADRAKKYFAQFGAEVFRYGGEEFAVIAEKVSAEEAFKFTDDFRQLIADEKAFPQGITVNISMGVLTYAKENRQELTSPDVVLRRTDAALYKSKETGRNKVTQVSLAAESEDDEAEAPEDFQGELF